MSDPGFTPVEPVPAAAAPPMPVTPGPPPPVYPAPPQYTQPQYTQPQYVQPQYPVYAPPQPSRGLAIAAMVLGIAGILTAGWGPLVGIAAVVFGHIAQRRQPHARPFWITGLITGYIGIGIGLLVLTYVLIVVIAAIATASS